MLKVKDIVQYFETFAPLALQESYDNSGLITGNPETEISSVLVTVDITEDIIVEAVKKNTGLIVSHHPVIFSGLKKLTGKTYTERIIIKAIRNNLAIYCAHTNIDAVLGGVNSKICEKLGLKNCLVLQPAYGKLKKLVTFIPPEATDKVRTAIFEAGAGNIGNYDYCGYNTEGTGSFRGGEGTNPYTGLKGQIHYEKEIRFETIFPSWLQSKILKALFDSHPYEEVAYDIYPLENEHKKAGLGMIGELETPISEKDFLILLKKVFGSECIRHTALKGEKVSKVAVCGGSGSFLLERAIAEAADFFVTGDFKYHQFFNADNKIVIADIGHFESEQFTKELFYELLTKRFPNFAVRFSEVNTNPVIYF